MFVSREKELHVLNTLYSSKQFEFIVIYGRRRVGKTALITEFIKNKSAIYFVGVESNSKQNLENLSKCIIESVSNIDTETTFLSFQNALEYIFTLSTKEKIILAIDEYPYVAKSSKSFASTLQLLIDKYKGHSKLKLILCGSSMSYMEDHVLAYKSPLYGRRTAQLKIEAFSFSESIKLLKNFSDEDKALIYGMFGGTPQYLLQINNKLSVKENIKNTFLNPNSFIFEEPINLLKQEVREPSLYTSIITAIATGSTHMSEISSKVGEGTNTISTYIKNLITLNIVQKIFPYGEKNSKKSIYTISDNMFRFWYRFIPKYSSVISRGASELAYNRIEPELSSYMGKVFENICKQYLWSLLLNNKSPVDFDELGSWWGTNSKTKSQEEIDIMGANRDSALFAECKWKNEKVNSDVLETLINRSNLFDYKQKYYYLFSKTGFTKTCINKATVMQNVSLVTYNDIINNAIKQSRKK